MPELSLEAKESVRKYLLSLFVLPSVIISAFGFALGYLISEGAKKDAQSGALQSVQNQVNNIVTDTYDDAREYAEKIAVERAKTRASLDDINENIKNYQSALDVLQNFSETEDMVNQITENLINSDSFSERIVGKTVRECKVCFKQSSSNSQCRPTETCSNWSSSPSWSKAFFDDTDNRGGGCTYQWKLECR